MNNVVLPVKYETDMLSDVMVGETVYSVPWAVYADNDGLMWVNGHYSFHHSPGGTAKLKLTRTRSGFSIDVHLCPDYGWHRADQSYVGGVNPIPVIEMKG